MGQSPQHLFLCRKSRGVLKKYTKQEPNCNNFVYIGMEIRDNILESVDIDEIIGGTFVIPSYIKEIANWAFCGIEELQEITIPDSVVVIGWRAFRDCFSLKKVSLSSSVKKIKLGAFYDCSSLEEIIIPASIESIGEDSFWGCHNLTNIIAPEHIKKEIEWQVAISKFSKPNEKIAQKFQEMRTKLQD